MNETPDVFEQAFAAHPVGVLLGLAVILIAFFLGTSLLYNG
jgi:hypothetical protein